MEMDSQLENFRLISWKIDSQIENFRLISWKIDMYISDCELDASNCYVEKQIYNFNNN